VPTEAIPRKLLVELRRGDYSRAGQIDERDIVDLKLVLRLNNLGAWSISMPSKSPAALELQVPGAGIVVSLDNEVLFSGPVVKGTLSQKTGDIDTWTFEGIDDNWVIADRLAWPSPTSGLATQQPGTESSGYDTRTGPAETVMLAYVKANVGPSAPTSRRVAVLDMAPDQARGVTVNGSARFTPLGELLTSFATLAALTFRVRANGDRLLFEVNGRQDRRALVRFDVDNETADDASYSFEAPGLTRAIVGGQGEAAQRTFIERTSAGAIAAEALWGRRREQFLDQRNGAQIADLQQAGDETLATDGLTKVSVSLTPVDTYGAQFWRDWRVGDLVSATVGDVNLEDVVSEATVTYGTDGFAVSAVLGDPTTAARTPLLQLLTEQRRLRTRTGRLERQ
jgi:hypothetical protein